MNNKYKSVVKFVDKLPDKNVDRMSDKEYKLIVIEIEKVIGK
jgi:hypothetical protein